MLRRLIAALAAAGAVASAPAFAQNCPLPDTRTNVVVGTVDSGVADRAVPGTTGPCRINDLIDETKAWPNQAAFVAHVQAVVNPLVPGTLSATEAASIIAAANGYDVVRVRPAKIIGFNDLHGNIEAVAGNFLGTTVPSGQPARWGGIDYVAGYVQAMRARNPGANFLVHAGDLVGATPLISALFLDEPTIEAMNLIGVDLGADGLGNHEFDRGAAELLRLKDGGCATNPDLLKPPFQTCQGPVQPFPGAKFPFISANVRTASGDFLVPPYVIKVMNGVRVGFISAVTETTPTIVTPSGVAGLTFEDEADAINALVGQLRNRGVEAIVMVVHEGGAPGGGTPAAVNACPGGFGGAIVDIVGRLDNAVDLVISGHSHNGYICKLANKTGRLIPVTQANAFGRLLTEIDLWIDRKTRDIVQVDARNVVVDRQNANITPDAGAAQLVTYYRNKVAPLANSVIGRITADVGNTNNGACQRQAGDLIADAQLAATQGPTQQAVIAFMNPGGIRQNGFVFSQSSGGEPEGEVTYGEAFTVQPFGNSLVTLTMTGQQIYDALAEQFSGCPNNQPFNRVMQVSAGFEYTWDNAKGDELATIRATTPTFNWPTIAQCSRIVDGSVKLNRTPINKGASYKVTVNNFMAFGGDNYATLNAARLANGGVGGAVDIDAVVDFLRPTLTGAPYAPLPLANLNRILRQGSGAVCPNS